MKFLQLVAFETRNSLLDFGSDVDVDAGIL